MSIFRFIIQSIRYFWRQHLTVFASVAVSTAVLTGALIVGDSVRLSLQKLVDIRLGNTRFALQTGGRFIHSQLAYSIADNLHVDAAPALILQGIAINTESDNRINNVQVVGVDSSFWNLAGKPISDLNSDEAAISTNLAERLNLKVGDEVLLRIENSSVVPRNTPFVQEIVPSVAFRFTIRLVADDQHMGRFSLKSNQVAPYNIFIPLKSIDKQLNLTGKANTILVSDLNSRGLNQNELDSALSLLWRIEDTGLEIRDLKQEDTYELISERIFIDQPVVDALNRLNLQHHSVLTYLANSISFGNSSTPYSFVTASTIPVTDEKLKEGEIAINDWLADDLKAKVGDSITLDYFIVGPLRSIDQLNCKFIVKEVIPVKSEMVDASLMPLFPGFANAGSCSDWSADVPIDWSRIRNKDEKYWNEYRGTPKAFISLEQGLKIWGNEYGNFTSLRFDSSVVSKENLNRSILNNVKPANLGIFFYPAYSMGLMSATNSVDFGSLFLSLSFFVIAAGVLLIVLIYSLNTESRKKEIGILAGLGFHNGLIQKTRIYESFLIALFGSITGALLGILYNYGLMEGLNSIWLDAVRTTNLEVFIEPLTILTGASVGFLIALLSIYLVVRNKLKQPVSFLVRNELSISVREKFRKGRSGFISSVLVIVTASAITIYSLISSTEINAEMFLTAGGLFMIGLIILFGWFIHVNGNRSNHKLSGLFDLAIKNLTSNKRRSISIVALLALGTFTVVITGANRKTFYGIEKSVSSGTGGYDFWAETTLPVEYDLNTKEGRDKVGLDDDEVYNVRYIQFHDLDGDDASCLNLNQVQQPRIIGVDPDEFNDRKAFSFANLMGDTNKTSPWLNLKKNFGKGVIPAFADQSVLTWGLKKSVGDTLFYINESGERVRLLLIGGLNNSIFQGNILISDSIFNLNFPSSSGSRIMLLDVPDGKSMDVDTYLSNTLTDFGIVITPTTKRLAEFNSVENTYLAVFMVLGGLGVIIGTIGLGIVLVRTLIDRRSELALITALGFGKNQIFRLILLENICLVLSGLLIGLLSATIGILPSIISPAFVMPGGFIALMILVILFTGILSIYLPVRKAMKRNIINGLRDE